MSDVAAEIDRQLVNGRTVKAYIELAGKCSKNKNPYQRPEGPDQRELEKEAREENKQKTPTIEQKEVEWNNTFDEVQQFGTEVQELLELTEQCDFNNVIHSAKIARCGEAHKRLAQQYFAKAKGEVEKAVKAKNSSGDDGGKYLAAAIGEQLGKPLTSVCRDRDTADGGKAGQMTSNPADVDTSVKRAWQQIHKKEREVASLKLLTLSWTPTAKSYIRGNRLK